jgi:hypothetical protein
MLTVIKYASFGSNYSFYYILDTETITPGAAGAGDVAGIV